ncbi:MAG TPA: hypothetical protein VH331_04280 [Allosphingosinicella sp.]|jgi:hypothetical protein|nr:hypothetical protein [Allosphingosinicella sp.]
MTTETVHFVINNALLCEDVRQEMNNKFIIIGVFSGDIILPIVPARVAISAYLDGRVKVRGKNSLHIRYSGPDPAKEMVIEAAFEALHDSQQVTIPLPRGDVLMDQEGEFCIDISDDGNEWVPLIRKRIILDPSINPGPIFSQPPSAQSQLDAPDSSSQPEPSRRAAPKKRRRS